MANPTPTLEQAEARVQAANDQHRRLAGDLAHLTTGGVPFGDSLDEARRIRLELEFAEQEATDAWAELKKLKAETESKAVSAAKARLDEAIPAVAVAAARVDVLVTELVEELAGLLDVSSKRDAARAVVNGRSRRTNLTRNAIGQWLVWRLGSVKLDGIPVWVNKGYRKALPVLLGVEDERDEEVSP